MKFQGESSVEEGFCESQLTKNLHVHRFFAIFLFVPSPVCETVENSVSVIHVEAVFLFL